MTGLLTTRDTRATRLTSDAQQISERPLAPFGLEVRVASGARFEDIDAEQIHAWVRAHRVVVIRGLAPFTKAELPLAARRLGPLQGWPFGAVNELERKKDAKNYLYTDRAVPLHWDGAFTERAPRYLFFHCVDASRERGGETVFVDTTRVWAHADDRTRDRFRALRFTYETEKVAHYGGAFSAWVVAQHPSTGETVLRFAEPVDDINPVRVRAQELPPLASAQMVTELRRALAHKSAVLAHAWQTGDVVIADNHALLHGRRAFPDVARRHIRRVNVHGPSPRTLFTVLRDSLRIRRPEFMVAEIPILLGPALLLAGPGALASATFAEIAMLFFLLFHFGDMVNCLADRDLDAVYKTHLSEAVHGLGVRNVRAQILATAAAATAIAFHLAITRGLAAHLDVIALVLVGLALGAQYSVGPLRLKGRGIFQVGTLWAVIFVGPMLLVARLFTEKVALAPVVAMLALIASYGAMQEGIILVNTAEDLPEDEDAKIRTAAVAFGLPRCLWIAATMVGVGGALTTAALFFMAHREFSSISSFVCLVPLTMAWLWVGSEIMLMARQAQGKTREEALAMLRPRARRMPIWITATAWTTLLAAASIGSAWVTR